MVTYILIETQSILLSASEDDSKQNINLHSVYNQSTFLLTSSWNQLDISLLSVQIHYFVVQLDAPVCFTYHMWKITQYISNHLLPLSLAFE
jgi:hypothetical protein